MPKENNPPHGENPLPPIKDIINIREWQKIQDNFSGVTEVGLRLLNPDGTPITTHSQQPHLCRELLPNSPAKEMLCGTCLPTFLHGKAVVDKNLSYVCEAGLHNFITPLTAIDGSILAYLVVGPVILVMRKSKEEYRQMAQTLGIEFEAFWGALSEIKTISFHCAKSLVELVKDVAEYTIRLAYQNIIFSPVQLTKILDALLDVAFEISHADIGSVMFLDKTSNALTIAASRGITEDIVRTARVKLGAGISGIAAKEGRAFLLDTASRENNKLAPYLNRPQLGSSMIIPLRTEEEVVGVMNIAALEDSEVRFDQDNVDTMSRLAGLVASAINP